MRLFQIVQSIRRREISARGCEVRRVHLAEGTPEEGTRDLPRCCWKRLCLPSPLQVQNNATFQNSAIGNFVLLIHDFKIDTRGEVPLPGTALRTVHDDFEGVCGGGQNPGQALQVFTAFSQT